MKLEILVPIACVALVAALAWSPSPPSPVAPEASSAAAEGRPGGDGVLLRPIDPALPERLSVRTPDAGLDDHATRALFEDIARASRRMDPEVLEPLLSRWLAAVPFPVESALDAFDRLDDDVGSARAAGLLLQACMLFAARLPSQGEPWTRAELSRHVLARNDASPKAAGVCRTALAKFAADVPPEELTLFIEHTGSGSLVHTADQAMRQRLFLIRELARGMEASVVPLLEAQVVAPGRTDHVRGLAANTLMDRDWRNAAPRLHELLEDPAVTLPASAAVEVRAALSGRYLELHGRDRLELLRELVSDDEVARMSLCNVPLDQARELAVTATAEDRGWPEFQWVELALGGTRGYDAGLELIDRLDGEQDQVYAAQVLASLLPEHLGEPALSERLERRFARRDEPTDPYWGALASVAHRLDEAAVLGEVLPRLLASRGSLGCQPPAQATHEDRWA